MPYLKDLAALRITVFADWPYLYAGSLEYEQQYLRSYAASAGSFFALALKDDHVVGVSTAVVLAHAQPEILAPLHASGFDPNRSVYFGESVLLPAYRGLGIGHQFFDAREAYARSVPGVDQAIFCAVKRSRFDPRRPSNARDLAPFWRARGYAPVAGADFLMGWQEQGRSGVSDQSMAVWRKAL